MKFASMLLVLFIAGAVSADSAMDRVMTLVEAGELQGAEAAYALAASVTDATLLPSALTEGTELAKCGTPAVMEAVRLAGLDPESPLAREALDLLARPTLSGPEYTLNSPGGGFKVHWTDAGVDASSLAYATALAGFADYCWTVECSQMGYDTPPSDLGMGGDNRYDLYIMSISALGYTTSSGEPSDPSTPENDYASHIVISLNMSDNLMKVTQAHEYQHAIQMGYDVAEATWFMENCSTWMEDMVYDDVNDYVGYLHSGDNPLRKPWWDIRSGSGNLYWYGGCVYTRYIWLRMGVLAVREIWEECATVWGNNMLAAQTEIFSNYGLTWEQAFMEYGCWRWFTAANWYSGCGMYDDEAALWTPGPYVFSYHIENTLPATGDEGVYEPETYGIHWIKVNLASYQSGWVNMHFDGRDNFDWNLGVIMWDTAGNHEFYWYNCDAAGVKDVSVNPVGWDYVIFFPAFMSSTSLDHYYDYSITYSSTGIEGGQPPEMIELSVSSNPAGPSSQVVFTMPQAGSARLDVFDISGRIVSTLHDGIAEAGQHSVLLGELTPGTYFVRLAANDQIVSRTVVCAD